MDLSQQVLEAEKRIRKFIKKTPLEFSPFFSKYCHANVYLKLESEQLTGSFKIRGAFNKMLISKDKLKNGFITASTGNHGKAVAYVADLLKIKGQVYAPKDISESKLEAIRVYDIDIKNRWGSSGEVEKYARKTAERKGIPYISPYNDIDIIAGQGTIGYEIFEELPSVDIVFICIGGGGMTSGIGSYLKSKNKRVKIIGCEPKNSCTMSQSIKAGKIVEIEHKPTLAEGSAGGIEPNAITFDLCKKYVDDYIQVSEREIKEAMISMIDKHHKIIEGAAAVPLAALLRLKEKVKDKNVVVVLSGSGMGINTLREVICS